MNRTRIIGKLAIVVGHVENDGYPLWDPCSLTEDGDVFDDAPKRRCDSDRTLRSRRTGRAPGEHTGAARVKVRWKTGATLPPACTPRATI